MKVTKFSEATKDCRFYSQVALHYLGRGDHASAMTYLEKAEHALDEANSAIEATSAILSGATSGELAVVSSLAETLASLKAQLREAK